MQAVILAAGMSTRLRPLTDERPKCLLEVDGLPILRRALDGLRSVGVERYVIITGYREEMIRKAVGTWAPGAAVFVENAEYANTNTCASVLASRPHVDGQDFLLLDGDVIFSAGVVSALLAEPRITSAALRPSDELSDEEVKAAVGPDGRRIVAISKRVPIVDAVGEAIGIYRIGADVSPRLFRTLEDRVVSRGLVNELYEASFQQMIDEGVDMVTVDVGHELCIEIDTPQDLEAAGRAIRSFQASRGNP